MTDNKPKDSSSLQSTPLEPEKSASKNEQANKTTSGTITAVATIAPQPARKKVIKTPAASRIFHLFSHVPSRRILRTVLAEMEEELRKNIPGANKKLTKHGQDARIITDIYCTEEGDMAALEEYNEIIEKAKESIALKAQEKIQNNDTILIYGYSEVIRDTILSAVDNGKNFSVIIVENSLGYRSGSDRPGHEPLTGNGQEIHALHIMKFLAPKVKTGALSVTFIHLNGLSFVIRTVTKLLMTAYALLTNGGVLGRIGTAQIALMAHKKNIPVVVCCETFKFCDKSPVDSFFQNQRGRLNTHRKKNVSVPGQPGDKSATDNITSAMSKLSTVPCTSSSGRSRTCKTAIEENSYLKAPILKYDITPAKFITAVITEVDVFPAQSIPLLLQVQESRNKNRGKRARSPITPVSSGFSTPQSSPEK